MTIPRRIQDYTFDPDLTFTVERTFIDEQTDTVCKDAPGRQAALEFWRCTNNVSARSGIVQEVKIVDCFDCTNLAWVAGRGYTFDGETFLEKPVLEDS